ncbi:hypothetical protein QAD02_010055 [Eretmocerus hayati]|uniref:Uncharacterized protein n=1 Tax=Eretmocerus hayati TaxID=131215 RepID=A0ACC2NBC4_9HYME|nr:hypothetical protein QAD02_010055 [Eretmocerus hayati]
MSSSSRKILTLRSAMNIMKILIVLEILSYFIDYGNASNFGSTVIDEWHPILKGVRRYINDRGFYHLTFFLPNHQNTADSQITNDVISYLTTRRTSISITLPISEDAESKMATYHRMLQNPRGTTLLISVFTVSNDDEHSVSNIKSTFEQGLELIEESSFRIRPRYLIIILAKEEIPMKFIEKILTFAWMKRFLDVTILQWSPQNHQCNSNIRIQSYNPFEVSYLNECYTPRITLFPNKLLNMHKYPFKASILRRTMRADFTMNSSGHVQNIYGIDHHKLSIISKSLNFSIVFIAPNVTNYDAPLAEHESQTLTNMIADGEIDYGLNALYIYFPLQSISPKNVERTVAVYYEKLVALVPVLPRVSSKLIYNNCVMCIGTILYVSIIFTVVKLLSFDTNLWSLSYTFRILVGSTVPRVSTKNAERVLFFFLLISSQKFAMDLFVEFTDNKINGENFDFYETLDDIKRSNIPLVIDKNYVKMTFSENDSTMQVLKKNIELIEDDTRCPNRIMSGENIVCLVDLDIAKYGIQQSKLNNGRKMKVMNREFWTAPKGFIFSQGSPYVEEFNRFNRRFEEGGFWHKSYMIRKIQLGDDAEIVENSVDHELSKKMLLICLSGWILSTIIFFIEVLVHRYLRNT